MYKFFLTFILLVLPTKAWAQYTTYNPVPTTIRVVPTVVKDSVRFKITWSAVSGYPTYELNTTSTPRLFELTYGLVVTGTTYTITVAKASLPASMKFYVNVRVSQSTPKYGSITYIKPVP